MIASYIQDSHWEQENKIKSHLRFQPSKLQGPYNLVQVDYSNLHQLAILIKKNK
jgi:hypothetical protein